MKYWRATSPPFPSDPPRKGWFQSRTQLKRDRLYSQRAELRGGDPPAAHPHSSMLFAVAAFPRVLCSARFNCTRVWIPMASNFARDYGRQRARDK